MSTFAMQKKIYENSLDLIRQDNATVKECLRSLKKAPKGSLFKRHIKSNGDSTGVMNTTKNTKGSAKNGKKQRKDGKGSETSSAEPKNSPNPAAVANVTQKSCLRPPSTTTKSNAGTVVYSRPAATANSRPAVIANSPGHKSPTVRQQLLNRTQQYQHQQQTLQQPGALNTNNTRPATVINPPNRSPSKPQQGQQPRKLFNPSPTHAPAPAPREWDVVSIDPDSVDSEFDIYQRAEDIAEIREKHLDLKRVRISTLLEAQHEDGGGFYRGEDFDNWSDED